MSSNSIKRCKLALAMVFLIGSFLSVAHAQPSEPTNEKSHPLTSDGTPMVLTLEDTLTGAKYEFTVNSTSQVLDILNSIMSTSQSAGSSLSDPIKNTINTAVSKLGVEPAVTGAKAQVSGLFDSLKQLSQKIQKPLTLGMKVGPYSLQFSPLSLDQE